MRKCLALFSIVTLAATGLTSCRMFGARKSAIVGASVDETQVGSYGRAPKTGWPLATPAERPGFYASPYSGELYDLRDVPAGALVRDHDTGQLFRKP